MELNLAALAPTCHVSGESFIDGERVVSQLVRQANGDVARYDVKPEREAQFEPPGRVACRWVQKYKTRVAGENPERELKLTADALFLTLADPATELSVENSRLVQFLALMLERKRLLKPRGKSADGTKAIFEHVKTKQRFEIPADELDPAFFVAVQEQLSVLVGEPKVKTAAAAGRAETQTAAPVGGAEPPAAEPTQG